MTGDSENEFDSVDETPATPPSERVGEGARPSQRRRFHAWESAQQSESALSKLGKRISGIFSKPKTPATSEPAIEQSSELELIMPADDPPVETTIETTDETADETPIQAAGEAAATFDVIPNGEPILSADIVPEVPAVPKPGLFSRLFGRKSKAEPPAEPAFESSPEPVSESSIEPFALEKDESDELHPTAPDDEPLIAPLERTNYDGDAIVAEAPQELALPDEPVIEAAAEPDAEEPVAQLLPPPMEEPTTAPIPESIGLFGRLFSRKPKVSRPIPVEKPADVEPPIEEMPALEASAPEAEEQLEPAAIVDEQRLEAPIVEDAPTIEPIEEELVRTDEHEMETFASVEDALPSEPEPSTVDLLEAALTEPIIEEEKKPGFFGRLFGRKSKSQPRPSLEIEVHEDRIEAAAHALDEVSGESFSGAAAESDPYASVEDALPVEEVVSEESGVVSELEELATPNSQLPTQDDLRFAPPPVAADTRSTLEIEPFDPFAQTLDPSRDTVETTPPDSRSTVEVPQREARSTEELELDAELGLTKSGDEISEKTDEFAIPSVDPEATTGELLETETTQAAKLTWWMRLLGRKPKTLEPTPGMATGTVVEGNPNFLFSKFKAFYNEIIRFRHQKTEFAAGFSTAILTDFNADLSPDAAAAAQSEQLKNMLDLQAAEAQWMGGEARDRYPDAQYAMACMADELFTHMEWDGQSAWKNHLLEVKLFRSHAADVELFKRIDKLLKESPNSHVARDLARVYLMVLAAGFQGKYRPFGLPRALAQYRQRLYEYIHQDDSLMLFAPDRKIFPEAAARTLEGHAVGRFSSLQRWAAILVFMVLGYTVLAHYAWNRVSADLKDVTERIRAASSTTGAATSPSSTNSTAASGGGGGR